MVNLIKRSNETNIYPIFYSLISFLNKIFTSDQHNVFDDARLPPIISCCDPPPSCLKLNTKESLDDSMVCANFDSNERTTTS